MARSQVTIPCSEKRNPVKATGPFLTRVEPLALDPIFHEGGSREGLEGGRRLRRRRLAHFASSVRPACPPEKPVVS